MRISRNAVHLELIRLESMKSFEERENLKFAIKAPDGQMVMPKRQWRWGPARVDQATKAGELYLQRTATEIGPLVQSSI